MPQERSAGIVIFRREEGMRPKEQTAFPIAGKEKQQVSTFIRQEKAASPTPQNEPLYLLLHYGAGHWDFPKGHVEKGESEWQAALRETQEETGLKASDLSPVFGFSTELSYFYRKEGKLVRKSVRFFLAETSQPEIHVSFEHLGYQWLPYAQAREQLTFKTAQELLDKARKFV